MILDNRYLYDILTEEKHPERNLPNKLLTGNEATQDALLSTESIEVRPLVPKGILSVRQTGIYRLNRFPEFI